jgi:hypothetical protein
MLQMRRSGSSPNSRSDEPPAVREMSLSPFAWLSPRAGRRDHGGAFLLRPADRRGRISEPPGGAVAVAF